MKKTNLLLLSALLLTGTFFSCSNHDDVFSEQEIAQTTKEIELNVKTGPVVAARSYMASAVGQTPDVKDLKLYFYNSTDNKIWSVQDFPSASLAGDEKKANFKVPSEVDAIYAIGNTGTIAESITLPTVTPGTTLLTELKKTQIDITKQTHPKTAVNVIGGTTIIAANKATLQLVAAPARIEIANVKSEESEGSNIHAAVEKFKLTGIFINNTYQSFGLDASEMPAVDLNKAIAYNKDAAVWDDLTNYPSTFCDYKAEGLAALSNTASPTNKVWGYFVPAINSGKGTAVAIEKSSVPHIILKLEDIKASGFTFDKPQYITIRTLKTTDGNKLTKLESGKYYLIKSINFGIEHLSAKPEDPSVDLEVTVEVKAWEEVEVEPEL